MKTYEDPPEKCDLCKTPIKGVFYDCVLAIEPYRRSWGNVCQSCYKLYGIGLGTGLGQKYEKKSDGKYHKTDG